MHDICKFECRSADLAVASAKCLFLRCSCGGIFEATGEKQGFRVSLSEKKDEEISASLDGAASCFGLATPWIQEFLQCRGQAWFASGARREPFGNFELTSQAYQSESSSSHDLRCRVLEDPIGSYL